MKSNHRPPTPSLLSALATVPRISHLFSDISDGSAVLRSAVHVNVKRIAKKQFEGDGRQIIDATVDGKCKIFQKGAILD